MATPDHPNRKTGKKWLWFHRFGSPAYFYGFADRWANRLGVVALALFIAGLYLGLFVAPPDYQMGDSYRIMFVHVPTAWMSMFCYVVMAIASITGLVWRMKLGFAVARACAPIGAVFTFCALLSGSLWGKPTWGTYWIWDARLTSELILLFLYIGFIALSNAYDERRSGDQAAGILAIVGLVNIPIIHYSVQWWNTLHQGSTVTRLGAPTIEFNMLLPLLVMFAAINFYFVAVVLNRTRCELLEQERLTQWVREAVNG